MNTELEKVSGIRVESRLLGPSETSNIPNLVISAGVLGLFAEAIERNIDPILTVIFITTILYGITMDILESIKPGEDSKHLN